MLIITGGDLLLPEGVLEGGTLVAEGPRIVAVERRASAVPPGAAAIDATGCLVAPGFIDVHVHGVEGHDALDPDGAVARIAGRLPRYGVVAFCPTTVACGPADLRRVLEQVQAARRAPDPAGARVLGAHLESNFINPELSGAQPMACLRLPIDAPHGRADGSFSAHDVLEVMATWREAIAIVTVAPELDGGLDLVRRLAAAGHRVSLGHSAADFETATAAFDAGARHATHLFNRMSWLTHRAPGLAGAALTREEVFVELICDGYHVHPATARVAIAAKGPGRVMAISDGTAASALPPGSEAQLGGRPIRARAEAAFLEDGTLAGSTLTMDGAFRTIVRRFGATPVDAARMCATTPAEALGLTDRGAIAAGAYADLVVLDGDLRVRHTVIGGRRVYDA